MSEGVDEAIFIGEVLAPVLNDDSTVRTYLILFTDLRKTCWAKELDFLPPTAADQLVFCCNNGAVHPTLDVMGETS